jgi:hypothetical protein
VTTPWEINYWKQAQTQTKKKKSNKNNNNKKKGGLGSFSPFNPKTTTKRYFVQGKYSHGPFSAL